MLKTDSALCRWIFLFIAWIFLQRPWQIALKVHNSFNSLINNINKLCSLVVILVVLMRFYLPERTPFLVQSCSTRKEASVSRSIQRYEICRWVSNNKWGLTIFSGKCVAVRFSRKRNPASSQIVIRDHRLPWEPYVQYLGLTLDMSLIFTQHFSTIAVTYRRPQCAPTSLLC